MNKKLLALFFSFAIVFSIPFLLNSNSNSHWTGWDFPERVENQPYDIDLLQVPEDILEKMSTEELVDVVLRYPRWYYVYLFSSYAEGVASISRDFNGMRELLAREDDKAKYFWDAYEKQRIKEMEEDPTNTLISRQILILLGRTSIVEELTEDEIEFIESHLHGW